jgi:hypothetical protein
MLRPGARWGRAAEVIARGSAVRGAAATIARRAGASKSLRACVYTCQNRMRRGFVPAGAARPTGAALALGGSPAQLQRGARWRQAPESSRSRYFLSRRLLTGLQGVMMPGISPSVSQHLTQVPAGAVAGCP